MTVSRSLSPPPTQFRASSRRRTLFAGQAKSAGVTVNVKKEPANAYFDTSFLYTKLDFGQDSWAAGSLGAWYELAVLSDAAWNETHWRDPEYDKLIRSAQGAPNEEAAAEIWREIQQIQYDQGGYIIWTNVDIVDAAASNGQGIVPSSFTALGGWTIEASGWTHDSGPRGPDGCLRVCRAPMRPRLGALRAAMTSVGRRP